LGTHTRNGGYNVYDNPTTRSGDALPKAKLPVEMLQRRSRRPQNLVRHVKNVQSGSVFAKLNSAICGIWFDKAFEALSTPKFEGVIKEDAFGSTLEPKRQSTSIPESSNKKQINGKDDSVRHSGIHSDDLKHLKNVRLLDIGLVTGTPVIDTSVIVEPVTDTEFSEDDEMGRMKLLSGAAVMIRDSKGEIHAILATADTGAPSSFISKEIVDRYELTEHIIPPEDIQKFTSPVGYEKCRPTTYVGVSIKGKNLGLNEFVLAKIRVLDGTGFEVILGRPFIGRLHILERLLKFDGFGKSL
jgi:hypothetical protein